MKRTVALLVFCTLGLAVFAQKPGAVSVQQPVESVVRFYPNPSTTVVNFEFPNAIQRGFNLQIFSFVGRKVLTVPVIANRTSVNISALMGGVYVFQLRDAAGRILACNKFQVSK
jgi:hypothetical protein